MDLNRIVAYALRAGVITGASLAMIGLVIWASQGFDNSAANVTDLSSIFQSAFAGNASGIVYLGIVILIATPILRVILSLVFFGSQRDTKYVGITAIVLAMLIFALLSGQIR